MTRIWPLRPLALAHILAIAGCGAGDADPFGRLGSAEGPATLGGHGCTDCIEVELLATLGEVEGPLEFGWPRPAYTDVDGRVHVIDGRNARESIVGPDFALVSDRRLPGLVSAAAPLDPSSGGRYVVNMRRVGPDGNGLPLHIIDGPDILTSFGDTVPDDTRGSLLFDRVLAVDGDGRIYAAKPYDYHIRVWTSDGEPIGEFRGPTLNETEVVPGPFAPDNPPPNRIFGLHVDDRGRLWVVRWQRRNGWRRHMTESVAPDGEIRLLPASDDFTFASIYTSAIDVVDLGSLEFIARQEFDRLYVSFIGRELLNEARFLDFGAPQVGVWRVRLRE